MGRIKLENLHVFDIHWLYRTSRYAIVKVDVNERNDVTKRHSNVVIIWRTSAIEVTALLKIHVQNERYARKRIYHGCEGKIKKNASLGITVWYHSASLVMPDSDSGRIFLSTPHIHDRFLYSCIPDNDNFDICRKKSKSVLLTLKPGPSLGMALRKT